MENFYFQYISVLRNRTNVIENFIYDYSKKFENEFTKKLLNDFYIKITSYIPTKEQFCLNFQNLGYSNKNKNYKSSANRRLIYYILSSFENYFNSTKETRILDFSIEHINSDHDKEDTSRMIGNLLPLSKKLNSNAGSLNFTDKLIVYKNSSFILVKKFIERYGKENWNDELIKKRTIKLSDLGFCNIWKLDS